MADELTSFQDSDKHIFEKCSSKLLRMVYHDGSDFNNEVNRLLDQINSLDYRSKLVADELGNDLLHHCCMIVPVKNENLAVKFTAVISNLLARQQLTVSAASLGSMMEYLVSMLQICAPWTSADALRAMSAVLYEKSSKLTKFFDVLIGPGGLLTGFLAGSEDDLRRDAIQCLERMAMRTQGHPYLEEEYIELLFHIFLNVAQTSKLPHQDDVTYCRILVSALHGLQNLLPYSNGIHLEHLGSLLGLLKMHMFHGVPGFSPYLPAVLYPTPMGQNDPKPQAPKTPKPDEGVSLRPGAKSGAKSASRKPRRGKKPSKPKQDEQEVEVQRSTEGEGQGPAAGSGVTQGNAAFEFYPQYKICSSESEFSDNEGGQESRLRQKCCSVRQNSLACLHSTIKATDKKILFGYWACFIPDTLSSTAGSARSQNLFTTILKDGVPTVRGGALAVLCALLDGSRNFLANADDSEQHRSAFTPFSVVLGTMVKEIHRCLLLALVSENSPLNITQIIKCLSTLMLNTPYHKLRPGLLTRIMKQVKPFTGHRDTNVRVACMTCFGALVGVPGPLLEVSHILQAAKNEPITGSTDSGFHSNPSESSSDGQVNAGLEGAHTGLSGISTPQLASGSVTPTSLELLVERLSEKEPPWLVRLCVRTISPELLSNFSSSIDGPQGGRLHQACPEPLPVRVESLQVLARFAKGYFSLARHCLPLFRDLIQKCLDSTEPETQLHSAKLLEEIGTVLSMQLQDTEIPKEQAIPLSQIVEFWTTLLHGPLPSALQNRDHANSYQVRTKACDCLSTIGADAFKELEFSKRIMCITLLLGMCTDEDPHVIAAAVRALGVYVFYPCLREDVGFVADAANCILTAMEASSLLVRMKAAWSLGNLSDALVMNKEAEDSSFSEGFSDMLLLKLLTMATKATEDSDKVKSNAVRTLGNLLHYVQERSLSKGSFKSATDEAVLALVKAVTLAAMKVRWNAAYAISNMFKNPLLNTGEAHWTEKIYSALTGLLVNCKNFKVRINACLALATPSIRRCYGSTEQYSAIWRALLEALGKAEMLEDFGSFQYRENLLDQLCGTLVHMTGLITEEDLGPVCGIMHDKTDTLYAYMETYRNNITKTEKDQTAKVAALQKAVDVLAVLNSQAGGKEEAALHMMTTIFSPTVKPAKITFSSFSPGKDETKFSLSNLAVESGFAEEDIQVVESSFKQTYD